MEQVVQLLQKPPIYRTTQDLQTLVQLTRNIKFFQSQGEKIHYKCCAVIKLEQKQSGQSIIKIGETGTKFYIILDGEVKVFIRLDNQFTEVARLKSGQAFGELALINESPRMATVECVYDTKFAVLQKQDFQNILGKIQRERITEKIEFFKGLPLFSK